MTVIDKQAFKKLEQGIFRKTLRDLKPVHRVRIAEIHEDHSQTLVLIQEDNSETNLRVDGFIAKKLNLQYAKANDEFVIVEPEE